MCELHGVPIQCLPKITSVDAGFGKIGNTPIRVSIVDQQAALYGHNCRKSGDCKITFGTGAFLLAVAGGERPETADLLPTIAWQRVGEEPTFALEGGVYDAGAALEWAQRIGLYSHVDELDGFDGPSALSATSKTPPVCPSSVAPGRPVCASQTRTVPSKPPLASVRPSAESATPPTAPVCPCTDTSGMRSATCHTRTSPPSVPAATSAPSALTATQLTA